MTVRTIDDCAHGGRGRGGVRKHALNLTHLDPRLAGILFLEKRAPEESPLLGCEGYYGEARADENALNRRKSWDEIGFKSDNPALLTASGPKFARTPEVRAAARQAIQDDRSNDACGRI